MKEATHTIDLVHRSYFASNRIELVRSNCKVRLTPTSIVVVETGPLRVLAESGKGIRLGGAPGSYKYRRTTGGRIPWGSIYWSRVDLDTLKPIPGFVPAPVPKTVRIVKWNRSEDYFVESKCGRFEIIPNYSGDWSANPKPYDYALRDKKRRKSRRGINTQLDAKELADAVVRDEIEAAPSESEVLG